MRGRTRDVVSADSNFATDDLDGDAIDNTLEKFENYDQYLDDQMEEKDLFYLEDNELARQLIEVGFHGKGEVLTRQQFEHKKQAYQDAKKNLKAA